MAEYTLNHWGTYEVDRTGGSPQLRPWRDDPDASPIGLDQMSERVDGLRVRRPSFREGWLRNGAGPSTSRGSDRFVELPWDEAAELVAAELSRVIAQHGNSAIYGGSYGWGSAGRFHHAQSQIHRFLNSVGGYVSSRDSYSFGAGSVIMPHVVNSMEWLLDRHTDWQTIAKNTRLFVAFGGLPLRNTQMTGGGAARHNVRASMEALVAGGARIISISPLRQDTPFDCEWVPIRPNTDVALMLALCQVLLSEGRHDSAFLSRYCVGFEEVERYLLGATDMIVKTPEWAEGITGVPSARIRSLAMEMASSRTMVNASWSLQRQSHGEQPYWSLVTLASFLGQIGLPGGGFGLGYATMNSVGSRIGRVLGPRLPQGRNLVTDFIPVARLSDMLLNPGGRFAYDGGEYDYPKISVVYWAGGNPFHHHQDLNRLMGAWQRPDTIIVHEQFWNSTAKAADIVLPASLSLEREDLGYASREGQLVAMKKLREPVGEARSDFEIFASIASHMGKREQFTEGRSPREWLIHMYDMFRRDTEHLRQLPDFETFWATGRLDLPVPDEPVLLLGEFRANPEQSPLPTPSGRIELFSREVSALKLADCPGQATWLEPVEWLGAKAALDYPIHLLSQEPAKRLHSQLDHAELSLGGKVSGHEPILIGEQDAAARGIRDGDVVRVFNARGAMLAGATLVKDIVPGVAVIATGAWFDPDEWTPDNRLDRHGNPNAVSLDIGASQLSQATVAQSCLVQVELWAGPDRPGRAHKPPVFMDRVDLLPQDQ